MRTNMFALALAAISTSVSAIAIPASVTSEQMVHNNFANEVTCGRKNPAINMAVQNLCSRDNLTVGTPWAREGVTHDNIKVNVIGPDCPDDSKWIPEEWCQAQFSHLCAVHNGKDGQGWMRFGSNKCQTWTIQEV